MTISQLIEKLNWFSREAVCEVNDGLLPGYVAGAYSGWGAARNLVSKWLRETQPPALPAAAVCFFKDGDRWCCVNGDFINLQESPAGFGETFEEALDELRKILPHSFVPAGWEGVDCAKCEFSREAPIHNGAPGRYCDDSGL